MATPDDLAALRTPTLVRYVPRRRGEGAVRNLFLLPTEHQYLTVGMAGLVADRAHLIPPQAAAHRCFETFCRSEPFAWATAEHNGYNNLGGYIWELKTFDVRAIGFFWRKATFIVTALKLKKELPKAKYYKPYITAANDAMNSLGLDPPPCVTGTKYAALF